MNKIIISLFTVGLLSNLVFAMDKIMESNITDTQFTISWVSSKPEIGMLKYGSTETTLDKIAYDDRGSNTISITHHVSVTGLSPQTTYYYQIISEDIRVENLTTGKPIIPTGNDLVYGKVFQADGYTPAEGTIVYLKLLDYDNEGDEDESSLYSILVNSDGYWYVNLVNFRTKDMAKFFKYSPQGDLLLIQAEGGDLGMRTLMVDTQNDTPTPDLILP